MLWIVYNLVSTPTLLKEKRGSLKHILQFWIEKWWKELLKLFYKEKKEGKKYIHKTSKMVHTTVWFIWKWLILKEFLKLQSFKISIYDFFCTLSWALCLWLLFINHIFWGVTYAYTLHLNSLGKSWVKCQFNFFGLLFWM